MAIDVSQLTDYSWADIAKAAKTAMLSAALGGAQLQINGRIIQRITVNEATQLYELAVRQMTNDANPSDGGIILAVFD